MNAVHVVFFGDLRCAVRNTVADIRACGVIINAAIVRHKIFRVIYIILHIKSIFVKLRRDCRARNAQRVDPRVKLHILLVRGVHHVFHRVVAGVFPLHARQKVRPRLVLRGIQAVRKRPHMHKHRICADAFRSRKLGIKILLERFFGLLRHIERHVRNPHADKRFFCFCGRFCGVAILLLRRSAWEYDFNGVFRRTRLCVFLPSRRAFHRQKYGRNQN